MQSRSLVRRMVSIAAVGCVALTTLAGGPAIARDGDHDPEPPPWLDLENGVTQPQFALADAIEEIVWVETPVDTDRDGRRDRVRIRISRPGETDAEGYKVPVVFEHSPYRGDFGEINNHPVDVDRLPQEFIGSDRAAVLGGQGGSAARAAARAHAAPDLPGSLDNYYVPRGYAVVLGESIGTFNSQGCPDVGGPAETLATKAVIDWLNGRARGYDSAGPGGGRVRADWTTGAVGMTGVSYNGTLPNQVATTGVEGLRTIIPVSAISSWYDYYRANGLVVAPHSQTQGVGDNAFQGEDTDVLASFIGGPRMLTTCADVLEYLRRAQDRVTGDYNRFWRARDYLRRADGVEASVFVVHGLNDWNVNTKAFAEWWYRLADNHVPRKLWLHNGGHGGPTGEAAQAAYKLTENRWFDHWLFGVANGIMGEPRVTLQREDGTYVDEAKWPARGTAPVRLRLGATDPTAPGTLSERRSPGRSVRQSFVDRGRELDTDEVLITEPDVANPHRLVYRSPELSEAVRLSGTPRVRLRASIDNRNAANLTAVVVDYGPAGSATEPVMVTRGWLDPQNRHDISDSKPLRQGREYQLRFDLQPDDYVFPAGHRIGLVVVSTDHDYTLRPLPGTRLTVAPGHSRLTLPLVGGRAALDW